MNSKRLQSSFRKDVSGCPDCLVPNIKIGVGNKVYQAAEESFLMCEVYLELTWLSSTEVDEKPCSFKQNWEFLVRYQSLQNKRENLRVFTNQELTEEFPHNWVD